MKQALQAIVDQLAALELRVGALDRAIHAHHRANDMSCRLETVPGIGVIGATAIASTVTDPSGFKSGRDFAAWIGLVPGSTRRVARSSSAASPSREIAISDGCSSSVQQKHSWIMRPLAKKPAKLVAVAVANKMARIAWAIVAKAGYYRAPELAATT
jgi:transposase